ncbi:rhomboid-related protein 4-like isoform X2 [Micropterus dolomieu]|uniref:rhomboid-related protein 4-like isoform X2 n=1 Tax=Micropterus dolomieu TaxID=147949 RepID=UPI001E8E6FB3|nr:rhomboid-related protein 4-like isoform X2 [Micropterus dolomieu]
MQRGFQLGLLLLAVQLFQEGLGNIPAVTLAVLGFNVYLYMFPAAPLMKACVSLQYVYKDKDWRRLFLSPLHHVDDWHLYFNMVSFLWKGVLFALKVVTNHYNPGGVTFVLNIRVSNRFASWVELVMIYLIAPGTSLIGHLAGILVGLLYTVGPLETIMKTSAEFVSSDGNNHWPSSYFNSSGYSGTRGERSEDPQHAEDYTAGDAGDNPESDIAGLTEEEQLEMAIRNSLNDGGGTRQRQTARPAYVFHPTEETPERRLKKERATRKTPNTSSTIPSHPCPHCPKKCSSRIGLYSHLRTHKDPEGGQ